MFNFLRNLFIKPAPEPELQQQTLEPLAKLLTRFSEYKEEAQNKNSSLNIFDKNIYFTFHETDFIARKENTDLNSLLKLRTRINSFALAISKTINRRMLIAYDQQLIKLPIEYEKLAAHYKLYDRVECNAERSEFYEFLLSCSKALTKQITLADKNAICPLSKKSILNIVKKDRVYTTTACYDRKSLEEFLKSAEKYHNKSIADLILKFSNDNNSDVKLMADSILDILPNEWVYSNKEIVFSKYSKHIEELNNIELLSSYAEVNNKQEHTDGILTKIRNASVGVVKFVSKNKMFLLPFMVMSAAARQQKTYNLNDGLVAYYPFNGNANDESGNNNHGTVYDATLTEDRFGNPNSAYRFDGADDYIDVSSFDPIQKIGNGNSYTQSIWFYQNPDTSRQALIGHMGRFYFINEGNYAFRIGWGNQYTNTFTLLTSPVNRWNHLIAICDADSNTIRAYQDGVPIHMHDYTGNKIFSVYAMKFAWKDVNYYFNGIIDDIRIYNRALSAQEIQELYNFNLNKGLVAYYPFNSNANDESGNGNHGMVYGATLTEDRFGNPNSAYRFDGADDYIDVSSFDPIQKIGNGNSYTQSIWFYQNPDTSKQVLIGHMGRFYFINEGNYAFRIGWGNQYTNTFTLLTSPVNRWNHLIAICDADLNTIRAYQDGVPIHMHDYTGNKIFSVYAMKFAEGSILYLSKQ